MFFNILVKIVFQNDSYFRGYLWLKLLDKVLPIPIDEPKHKTYNLILQKMTYLRTVLARTALQDLRYLFGQQAPFLGNRHSSSRLISSNSINKSSSVTLILFPFDPSFNFAIASTESAENLQINILSRICDPAFHFTFQLQLRSPDLS